MITQGQIATVLDHPVYDIRGSKIGDTGHVFLDGATGEPEWVSVQTGHFGTRESLVPLHEATIVEDHLEVPYAKTTVRGRLKSLSAKRRPEAKADGMLADRGGCVVTRGMVVSRQLQ
ncbi:PRC-barrel domain-containing protein [Streptomyces sp. LN245]|uniref:PRC-barrel domain-containing protein n=1 Tax=Streptomyces sp. LN245 TaxID=3112975 RepID=UPI0037112E67